jgi:hypothetical protein
MLFQCNCVCRYRFQTVVIFGGGIASMARLDVVWNVPQEFEAIGHGCAWIVRIGSWKVVK